MKKQTKIVINTGFVVGESSTILKTTNAGTNWNTLTSGTNSWLSSVFFVDAKKRETTFRLCEKIK